MPLVRVGNTKVDVGHEINLPGVGEKVIVVEAEKTHVKVIVMGRPDLGTIHVPTNKLHTTTAKDEGR